MGCRMGVWQSVRGHRFPKEIISHLRVTVLSVWGELPRRGKDDGARSVLVSYETLRETVRTNESVLGFALEDLPG